MSVVKKIKFVNMNKTSIGYLVFDQDSKVVGYYHRSGPMPYVDMVLMALISDRDGQALYKHYISSTRRDNYRISCREGMSGCQDWHLELFDSYMGQTIKRKKKHLLHISMEGKINWGLDPIYIGDLVELIAIKYNVGESTEVYSSNKTKEDFLNLKRIRRSLIKYYGMKYIPEKEVEDNDLTRQVTRIF